MAFGYICIYTGAGLDNDRYSEDYLLCGNGSMLEHYPRSFFGSNITITQSMSQLDCLVAMLEDIMVVDLHLKNITNAFCARAIK